MMRRLAEHSNEWINRTKPVPFKFEGKDYIGFEGDTITSALLANGECVLGRSFKYHRPRSVLSFANHDVNIMMTDGKQTNIRADVTPLKAHMQLTVVNTSGGVKHDKKRWLDKISAILPVGFYYKAFFKPKALFPIWEKLIRQSAGLGRIDFNSTHRIKPKSHQFTDVLIVGGGVAGLMAAIEAAQAGAQVTLVDENKILGGCLNDGVATDETNRIKHDYLIEKISTLSQITCIQDAYVAGYYADHLLPIVTKQGMIKIRAKAVIVATGAFEQPPVFRNNDLSGVMLSSAAQRLVARYRVAPFSQGVVFTANSQGYRAALDLLEAGITIKALVDLRKEADEPLAAALTDKGVSIYPGYCIYEATPDKHQHGVKSVTICPYHEATQQADIAQATDIACDGVMMSAGWSPAAALLYQAGTKMAYNETVQQFVPQQLPNGIFAAGRVNGVFELSQCVMDGKRAANEALEYLELPHTSMPKVEHIGSAPSHPYPMVPHPKGKNFIDFDEDIQLKDFFNAAQEGFNNIELMKRYTTFGMGPSQGKHANMNAIRVLSHIRQQPIEQVGSTTARPFYHPTALADLAGYHFKPYQQSALHHCHQQAQAEFTQAGSWIRPAYYKQSASTADACITQEVLAVRRHVGLIDVSTLGKIEVYGKQAAEFLERFYTGYFTSQKVGHLAYGLAIDETGVILDDGIIARIAAQHFYVTTSTSQAAHIYREMLRYIQLWAMDVTVVNVTSRHAAINLAGQQATTVISTLLNISLDYGQVKDIQLGDVEMRIMRAGFVSKQAYEIHLPVNDAAWLWQALLSEGEPYQIQPFGTEAQRILRLEMGHCLIGQDTDGLTNPFEAGFANLLKSDKPFFIGQRSLQIINQKPCNKKLVGFILNQNTQGLVPEACNLVIQDSEITGRVTSIAMSPTIKQYIGLAYVHPSQSAVGMVFDIRTDSGAMVTATVANTPFINKGEHDAAQ